MVLLALAKVGGQVPALCVQLLVMNAELIVTSCSPAHCPCCPCPCSALSKSLNSIQDLGPRASYIMLLAI